MAVASSPGWCSSSSSRSRSRVDVSQTMGVCPMGTRVFLDGSTPPSHHADKALRGEEWSQIRSAALHSRDSVRLAAVSLLLRRGGPILSRQAVCESCNSKCFSDQQPASAERCSPLSEAADFSCLYAGGSGVCRASSRGGCREPVDAWGMFHQAQ